LVYDGQAKFDVVHLGHAWSELFKDWPMWFKLGRCFSGLNRGLSYLVHVFLAFLDDFHANQPKLKTPITHHDQLCQRNVTHLKLTQCTAAASAASPSTPAFFEMCF
jgi:hypothetical protein